LVDQRQLTANKSLRNRTPTCSKVQQV